MRGASRRADTRASGPPRGPCAAWALPFSACTQDAARRALLDALGSKKDILAGNDVVAPVEATAKREFDDGDGGGGGFGGGFGGGGGGGGGGWSSDEEPFTTLITLSIFFGGMAGERRHPAGGCACCAGGWGRALLWSSARLTFPAARPLTRARRAPRTAVQSCTASGSSPS